MQRKEQPVSDRAEALQLAREWAAEQPSAPYYERPAVKVARALIAAEDELETATRLAKEESSLADSMIREANRLRAECEQMRKYVAHHDEEYLTMKAVLRAEHEECQRLRAALAAHEAKP